MLALSISINLCRGNMIWRLYRRRPGFTLLFFVLCVQLASPAMAAQPQPAPGSVKSVQGPSIELAEIEFNFGEASEAGEVVHDFVVRNSGSEVLQIQQVSPG